MLKRTALVGMLIVGTPVMAQTAPSGPTERGSMLIAGSASVSHTQRSGTGTSVTSMSVQPSILYFVADRLALGGQFGIGYASLDNGHASNWLVGPAARLFFGSGSSKAHPYVGVAMLRGATSTSSDSDGPFSLDSRATVWGAEGLTGLALMLSRQVGITGEAFWRREESKLKGAQALDVKDRRAEYGVRFGVAAFLF